MQIKLLRRFLWLYLALMFFIFSYIYGVVMKANGDNVEHLHTSWMVWMGYTPYKDFFQHHNPLTWYLSAPLVAALINNFSIYAVFNIIGVLMLYVIAYFQSRIFLLDNSNRIAALFLAAILVSAYSLLWSTDYRPDTFMFVFFYMGLFYLFDYIKKQKTSKLCISFCAFFISFLFTQKVLMHVVVPGGALIYWLVVRKIKLKDLLYASILPLIMLGLFIGWLYYHDMIKVYWLSNYIFNTYIPKIFEQQRIIFPPQEYIDFYIFLPVAVIASIYFLIKGTETERIFSLMFILETGLRMFYFSAFLHYVIFWLMTAIMLTVMFLSCFDKKRQIIAVLGLLAVMGASRYLAYKYGYVWTSFNYKMFGFILAPVILMIILRKFISYNVLLSFLGVLYLLFMAYYSYHLTYKNQLKLQGQINGHEFSFTALTPCDYAINGYYATYNLQAKDPGYYSILLGQIDVLGEKTGVAPRDDLNDLIRRFRPKIVSANTFWDTYWEQRGRRIPAHVIDPMLLSTYYEPTGVGSIYILKPQYQHHTCVYNGKYWRYMD